MPHFRVTVRYGRPRPQYEVLDLEGEDIGEAMTAAVGALAPEVRAAADLVEVRVLVDEEEREYIEG